MKLIGAGTLFLGLGAFSISNLKNIGEASATTEAAPPSNNTNSTRNDMGIRGSMIAHIVRFTLKPNAPKDQVDLAFESLRKQGREINAVQLFAVGRDFGGEFDYDAMYIMKDIEAYREYMLSPIHRKSDELGLPITDKFVSMDLANLMTRILPLEIRSQKFTATGLKMIRHLLASSKTLAPTRAAAPQTSSEIRPSNNVSNDLHRCPLRGKSGYKMEIATS